jgi:hypothetical protein
MAEVVEHELMENVCNLKSYIKDTTELLRKLNKIPQPLPGEVGSYCCALCLNKNFTVKTETIIFQYQI